MPSKIENLDEIVGLAYWKYLDPNKDNYTIITRKESGVHVIPKSSCDFEAITAYLALHKDKFYLSRETNNSDEFKIIVYFRKDIIENGEFEFVKRYDHIATVGFNPLAVYQPRERIDLFYKANSHNELLGRFYTLKTNFRRYLIDTIGITDEDVISNLELKYELEVSK